MAAVSAAYQRARRWKLKRGIKLVKATHQEDGKKVVTVFWRPLKVEDDMKPWITQEDLDKAATLLAEKNRP